MATSNKVLNDKLREKYLEIVSGALSAKGEEVLVVGQASRLGRARRSTALNELVREVREREGARAVARAVGGADGREQKVALSVRGVVRKLLPPKPKDRGKGSVDLTAEEGAPPRKELHDLGAYPLTPLGGDRPFHFHRFFL